MASAAPTARRASSRRTIFDRNEGTQTEDWPEEVNDAYSRGEEGMQFSGDGLNTGVRVTSL